MSSPATAIRHRPDIVRTASEYGTTYRMRCPCGTTGPEQAARRMAQVDLNTHVLSLPRVPAAQRCHDQARHDRRDWEPCAVCEHQMPLFDLTIPTSEEQS
ncbi:hypothetical protein AB0395_29700 [Streptosporangium sp. NPDC051023]|uniref:hypothetical protein n=1 Tax=Streptosporangium sp. NPDC051023 TaxID=3155410 RepID=UPI0034503A14